MTITPEIRRFFDEAGNSTSHIVHDPATRACAVIDSVLGFDMVTGRTSTAVATR